MTDGIDDESAKCEASRVLSEFLAGEIGQSSVRAWARAHGLRPEVVSRARAAKTAAQLDTLQEIADALQVEAWQLLYPGFSRKERDALQTLSAEAIDAAKMLDALKDEGHRRFAFAALMSAIALVRPAQAAVTGGPLQPVPPPKLEPPKD